MRWLILSLFVVLWFVPNAQPQEAGSESPAEKVTYFLIDASGSMTVGKGSDSAEENVLEILEPLQATTPEAPVSRTYFRAANRDLCSHPIQISRPVAASESVRANLVAGNNDYTPLGTALASAIKQIGDFPADLFLVTDGYQSSDCGPDACTVASEMLPLTNLNVRVLPVGEASVGIELEKCIEVAQAKVNDNEEPSKDTGAEQMPLDEEAGGDEPLISKWAKNFIRQWYWSLGVILILASAASLGLRETERALILQQGKEKARSLQDAIREGDQTAEKELDQLLSNIENEPKLAEPRYPYWKRIWKFIVRFRLGLFGVAWLGVLALLPRSIAGVSMGGTKDAAWAVFNSQFATAFSLALISVVFFAGSQNQKKREARHGFDIETDAAKRVADRERTEARSRSYKQYTESFDAIGHLPLTELSRLGEIDRDSEIAAEDVQSSMQVVTRYIRERAQGQRLSAGDSIDVLNGETTRLQSILRSTSRFLYVPPDSRVVIDRLVSSGRLENEPQDWLEIRKALSPRDDKRLEAVVLSLAAKLRGNGAS